MKYEKPVAAVDRYELSQSIAGCAIKVGYDTNDCFLKDSDVLPLTKSLAVTGWFVDFSKGCAETVKAGTTYDDGICYHTQANGALVS